MAETATFAVAAGNLIVFGVGCEGDPASVTITVTDSIGTSYTAGTQRVNGTDGVKDQLFWGIAPSANAANKITVTLGRPQLYIEIGGVAYTGQGLAPFVAEAGTTTSGTAGVLTGPSIDPTAAGVVVAFFKTYPTPTWSAGPAAMTLVTATTGRSTMFAEKIVGAAGSVATGANINQNWGSAISVMAFRETAATTSHVDIAIEPQSATNPDGLPPGATGLAVHLWTDDPSAALATLYTGVTAQAAPDTNGRTVVRVSPAPAGTTNGQQLLADVRQPLTGKCSGVQVPATVVVTGDTGGGGGGAIQVTLDDYVNDMTQQTDDANASNGWNPTRVSNPFFWITGNNGTVPPAAVVMGANPYGSQITWAGGTDMRYFTQGDPRDLWNTLNQWFVAYEGKLNNADNCAIEVGGSKLRWLSKVDNLWRVIAQNSGSGTGWFNAALSNIVNGGTEPPVETQITPQGTIKVRLPKNHPYAVHGVGSDRIDISAIRGAFAALEAIVWVRLALWDAAGANQLASAYWYMDNGADYYPTLNRLDPPFAAAPPPGAFTSRVKRITTTWKPICVATILNARQDYKTPIPAGQNDRHAISEALFRASGLPLDYAPS